MTKTPPLKKCGRKKNLVETLANVAHHHIGVYRIERFVDTSGGGCSISQCLHKYIFYAQAVQGGGGDPGLLCDQPRTQPITTKQPRSQPITTDQPTNHLLVRPRKRALKASKSLSLSSAAPFSDSRAFSSSRPVVYLYLSGGGCRLWVVNCGQLKVACCRLWIGLCRRVGLHWHFFWVVVALTLLTHR